MCHLSLPIISWTNFIFPTLRDYLKIDTRCQVILRNSVMTHYLWKYLPSGTTAAPLLSHSPRTGTTSPSRSPASRSYEPLTFFFFFHFRKAPGNCLIIKNYTPAEVFSFKLNPLRIYLTILQSELCSILQWIILDRIFSLAKNKAQIKFHLNKDGLTKLDRGRAGSMLCEQLKLVKNPLYHLETIVQPKSIFS